MKRIACIQGDQNQHNILKILSISMLMLLTACQPRSDHEQTDQSKSRQDAASSTAAQDQLIMSKTVPLKATQALTCDEQGCTQYRFQTVETNHEWINRYFKDRIQKANPVAFQQNSTVNKPESVDAQNINQHSMIVRFVGQNQHLATFELMDTIYAAGAAHGTYHNEFVNFDLNQRKRISLDDLTMAGAQTLLRDRLYDTNTNWLMAHTIDKDKLNVSDNFYYGANGIVFVYPLYELASYAEGMSELTLPYHQTAKLIKPEYLPHLPQYAQ